jgi:hypothetical protein
MEMNCDISQLQVILSGPCLQWPFFQYGVLLISPEPVTYQRTLTIRSARTPVACMVPTITSLQAERCFHEYFEH